MVAVDACGGVAMIGITAGHSHCCVKHDAAVIKLACFAVVHLLSWPFVNVP
jgi:hypothetical protein